MATNPVIHIFNESLEYFGSELIQFIAIVPEQKLKVIDILAPVSFADTLLQQGAVLF